MPADYKENAFEAAIEDHLLAHGYAKGDNRDHDAASAPDGYDRARALFPGVFAEFVKATQPQAWSALEKLHAGTAGGRARCWLRGCERRSPRASGGPWRSSATASSATAGRSTWRSSNRRAGSTPRRSGTSA